MPKGEVPKSKHTSTLKLDHVDWKILLELQTDARLSYAELGRRCKRSRKSILARVFRMEKAGIIRGYRALVNPKTLGIPFKAIIRLSLAPDRVKQITPFLKSSAEISECHIGEGKVNTLFITAHFTSTKRLENLVDHLAIYGSPRASIVLSSLVEDRAIEPPPSQ